VESCLLDFTSLYHVSCQLDATTWLAVAIFNTQHTHLFHCITCSSQCLPDGRKANNNPLAQFQLFLQFLEVYVRCVSSQALEELQLLSTWTDRRRYRQTYPYISLYQHLPSSFAFLCISKPWLDRVCMMFQQDLLDSALLAASVLNDVVDGAGSTHVNECLAKVFWESVAASHGGRIEKSIQAQNGRCKWCLSLFHTDPPCLPLTNHGAC